MVTSLWEMFFCLLVIAAWSCSTLYIYWVIPCGESCSRFFPKGLFSCANFASLDHFTQPNINSGSYIFVLCQLFLEEQCATVFPFTTERNVKRCLFLDCFSCFICLGRKYVIKTQQLPLKELKLPPTTWKISNSGIVVILGNF